jgi:hypothetical protein
MGHQKFIREFANSLLPMCLLCSDCKSLAKLESAICTSDLDFPHDDGIFDGISQHLVQPLLNCLGNENTEIQMGALLALRSLSKNKSLQDRFGATVVSHLMPYLSNDDDVDYTVFARSILHWTNFDDNTQFPDTHKILQRLLGLLSHGQGYVVTNAVLGIKDTGRPRFSKSIFKKFLLDEAQRLIGLLSSRDSNTAGVLQIIQIFTEDPEYLGFFIGKGIIHAIVPLLSTNLRTTLLPALQVILRLLWYSNLGVPALVEAGLVPHLVRLIPRALLAKKSKRSQRS